MGNTRLSFDQNGAPKQQDDYYPFGMEIPSGTVSSPKNEYLYNKKELQEELTQYNYGARFYDPVIGRFTTVDPLADKDRRCSPYGYGHNNPISHIDVDGMFDWVDRGGEIVWDDKVTSANDKDLQKGDVYLGKNVLVGTDNRDANLNEPINSARFDLYLESDKTGPTATIMGNTVPADVTKYGTLKEGVYPAEAGSRSKYPNEQALVINGGKELPTANGNPHDPKGQPVDKQTLTGVFFHQGNAGRASLTTSKGKPISEGCQTGGCGVGSKQKFDAFMKKVPDNFKGTYYLRHRPKDKE